MQIEELVKKGDGSAESFKQIAEAVRSERNYRWVGLYEVTETEIGAIAWTGAEAPAYPRFPVAQGLCGEAVRSRAPVIVGDVRNDPRYLTTFGNTQSEMIVPVLTEKREVVGLIDVESERLNAFDEKDVRFLQDCAKTLRPIF